MGQVWSRKETTTKVLMKYWERGSYVWESYKILGREVA
jgi:hypothetical protein